MSTPFQFELISPQKSAFNKQAVMVNIPGREGRFGVLAGHAPLAASIGPGVVEIFETDAQTATQRFFVTGGFCQIDQGRCTLLADQAISTAALKREDVEAELKDLEAKAYEAETEEARAALQDQLASVRAKLLAAG